jgi:hypothetical protein
MLHSRLLIKLIDISSIKSTKARSSFSNEIIEALAENFVKTGGNLQPILLEQLDLESYHVISGDLEFYAAMRAREINDDFEMVNAIILTSKNRKLIEEQYRAIDTGILEGEKPKSTSLSKNTDLTSFENNLISYLQTQLDHNFSKLDASINQGIDKKFEGTKIVLPRGKDYLNFFNDLQGIDLVKKLKRAGIRSAESTAQAIEEERGKGEFKSLSEIVERVRLKNKKKNRAISQASMLKIIDSWSDDISIT